MLTRQNKQNIQICTFSNLDEWVRLNLVEFMRKNKAIIKRDSIILPKKELIKFFERKTGMKDFYHLFKLYLKIAKLSKRLDKTEYHNYDYFKAIILDKKAVENFLGIELLGGADNE